jgi:hypothetical protein
MQPNTDVSTFFRFDLIGKRSGAPERQNSSIVADGAPDRAIAN